ncbi:MAG: hypothetical protein ACR5LG_02920 [Sodalis sp. (in: enterobacteria)]|uniref:hypothetical protein n=1 Tax=Sodalis sp. (in: enterobacteria) TaxID=1898979 RepID=UPI003F2B0B5D
MGAPVGSLLCGSTAYIAGARYTLAHHVTCLQEDHDNVRWLAQQLAELVADVVAPGAQTNTLFIRQSANLAAKLAPWMRDHGIIIALGTLTRLVTYLNVSRQDLKQVVDCWRTFLAHHDSLVAAPSTSVYFQ